MEKKDNILFELHDKLVLFQCPKEDKEGRRIEWNRKVINFIKYDLQCGHVTNVSSIFGQAKDVNYRTLLISTIKDIAASQGHPATVNYFSDFSLEVQENETEFKFRKIEK